MLKNIKILRGLFFEKTVYFLSIFLLIMACEEPKKGCTDIRATNFDVAAAHVFGPHVFEPNAEVVLEERKDNREVVDLLNAKHGLGVNLAHFLQSGEAR